MPQPPKLVKARLTEIWRNDSGDEIAKPNPGTPLDFEVQFNPESLRVSYGVVRAGGDRPQGATQQFVGTNSTRLSMQLWFDITRIDPASDVRLLTRNLAYFLEAQQIPNRQPAPPSVKFQWGAFLFRGVLDSIEETLELFSDDGRALRANVSIALSEQRIVRDVNAPAPGAGPSTPGTRPLFEASFGASLPQVAASAGLSADWKGIAAVNGVDNPRQLAAGARLDLSAKGSVDIA